MITFLFLHCLFPKSQNSLSVKMHITSTISHSTHDPSTGQDWYLQKPIWPISLVAIFQLFVSYFLCCYLMTKFREQSAWLVSRHKCCSMFEQSEQWVNSPQWTQIHSSNHITSLWHCIEPLKQTVNYSRACLVLVQKANIVLRFTILHLWS